MQRLDVTASAAGKKLPVVEKFASEVRLCRVDCTPLLRPYELMAGVLSTRTAGNGGARVVSARTREGKYLDAEIQGGGESPARGATHSETTVVALVKTTQGQMEVRFIVRAHL